MAKQALAKHTRTQPSIKPKVFNEIKDLMAGYHTVWLAETARVSPCTLYNWLDGTTRFPRLDTIFKVARAMGYDIVLQKRSGHRTLKAVK